jgi:hypothetical protein
MAKPSATRASQAARLALVLTALLLPSLSLVPLGGLYLWEKGYLLWWAIGSAVAIGLVHVAQSWLFAHTPAPAHDTQAVKDELHPSWSPLEAKAWADVKKIAANVDIDKLADGQSIFDLGTRTINVVAQRIHPGKADAVWRFTMPEALAILERVSSRLSTFIQENIPFGDRLTVSQVLQVYRWRAVADVAERAYDIWRIVRLSNPAAAITNEARERLSRAMLQWGREHVSRRLAETYVEEVGRAAIDLYGGRLQLSHERIVQAHGARRDASVTWSDHAIAVTVIAADARQRHDMAEKLREMEARRGAEVTSFVRGVSSDLEALTLASMMIVEWDHETAQGKTANQKAASSETDVVVLVLSAPESVTNEELRLLDTVCGAANTVPPVLIPVEAVAGRAASSKQLAALKGHYPGHVSGIVSSIRNGSGESGLETDHLWSALAGNAHQIRRVQLLRSLEQAKQRRSWKESAVQAATAAGRLAISVVPKWRK